LLTDLRDALLSLPEDPKEAKALGFDRGYYAFGQKPKSPKLGDGSICGAYGLGTTLPSWQAVGLGLKLSQHSINNPHVKPFYMPSSLEGTTPREILGLSERQWDIIVEGPTGLLFQFHDAHDAHAVARCINKVLEDN